MRTQDHWIGLGIAVGAGLGAETGALLLGDTSIGVGVAVGIGLGVLAAFFAAKRWGQQDR
jgi:ABC-type antimicrobial peptide transport system permease subunit